MLLVRHQFHSYLNPNTQTSKLQATATVTSLLQYGTTEIVTYVSPFDYVAASDWFNVSTVLLFSSSRIIDSLSKQVTNSGNQSALL